MRLTHTHIRKWSEKDAKQLPWFHSLYSVIACYRVNGTFLCQQNLARFYVHRPKWCGWAGWRRWPKRKFRVIPGESRFRGSTQKPNTKSHDSFWHRHTWQTGTFVPAYSLRAVGSSSHTQSWKSPSKWYIDESYLPVNHLRHKLRNEHDVNFFLIVFET